MWAKEKYPDFWIGINLIGHHIPKVLNFLSDVIPDGVWFDNSNVTDKDNQNVPIISVLLNVFTFVCFLTSIKRFIALEPIKETHK